MATGQNDFAVTGAWTDLVATIAAAASTDTLIQNLDTDEVQIVAGGASAPTGKSGVVLREGESVTLNAANLWLRARGGAATVSVTTL